MKTLLFGAGHKTEQARKKLKHAKHAQKYGTLSTSNTSRLYPVNRSSTFPSYFNGGSSSSRQHAQPGRLLTDLDSFSRSPEAGNSPVSPTSGISPLKRKLDELELNTPIRTTQTKPQANADHNSKINPEHEDLKTWAAKPKRRLTQDPQKKAEVVEHNQRIQEARKKCGELGLNYEA